MTGRLRRQNRLHFHRSGRGDENVGAAIRRLHGHGTKRPTRHAGRGGVGAVMGAKENKGDRPGRHREENAGGQADPEKFKEANKVFVAGLNKPWLSPVKGFPPYGTNVLDRSVINEAGAYPTRQFFHQASFAGAGNISGETQAEMEKSPWRRGFTQLTVVIVAV